MIRATLVIKELSRKDKRVRGAIEVRSQNFEPTEEEMRVLNQIMEKVKEVGQEIAQERHAEVSIWEQHKKEKCTTSPTR